MRRSFGRKISPGRNVPAVVHTLDVAQKCPGLHIAWRSTSPSPLSRLRDRPPLGFLRGFGSSAFWLIGLLRRRPPNILHFPNGCVGYPLGQCGSLTASPNTPAASWLVCGVAVVGNTLGHMVDVMPLMTSYF